VFVEGLHGRLQDTIKGCVRGAALLARHPPPKPQPSPKVEPEDRHRQHAPHSPYKTSKSAIFEGPELWVDCFLGSVLDVEMTVLDKQSKGIPIDEQANDNVVHLYRFREADRLTDQAFDPCA